jgi:hypothetical protein
VTHPLVPFVFWKWPAPYTWEGNTRDYRVVPVRCKSGIAMARKGATAHQATAVAALFHRGKAHYAARWTCGAGSTNVILLASADRHGGVCQRCQDTAAGPCVYRCFAAPGELLYIGSTNNRSLRIGSHRSQSPWWPEVADIQYQSFPTLTEARVAERLAIQAEQPARNRHWKAAS